MNIELHVQTGAQDTINLE